MPPQPKKSPASSPRSTPLLWPILYGALLAALLLFCAEYALKLLAIAPEFAQAGDYFGYAQMAQDIRAGSAPNHNPQFTFNSPHAQLLLRFLQSQNLPLDSYTELLAPNTYHYQPKTVLIANQYPPGVPYLLALFPKDNALHLADYLTLAAILAFPFTILYATFTRWKNQFDSALLAAAFAALAAAAAFMMFAFSVSYSIDLFSLPLLAIFTCIHFALPRQSAAAKSLALLAGIFFGYTIACRLAAILFLPGFLLLLIPQRPNLKTLAKPALFLLAAILCGILPLLIHQYRLTGSLLVSTYIGRDIAPPSISCLPQNAAFYALGAGNLFTLTLLLAAASFYLLLLRRRLTSFHLTRYAQAIPLFFAIPTAYFLTHAVTTDYYQLPTILVCLFAIAFASLNLIPKSTASPRPNPKLSASLALVLAAILAWHAVTLAPLPPADRVRPPSLELPAALQNPNAWIFGDRFTGTLWYYHHIPSGAILHASPQARLLTYQFIFHRHEPLLLLQDNPALDPILTELHNHGATLEHIANFGNRPVLRIHWPPTGPTTAAPR